MPYSMCACCIATSQEEDLATHVMSLSTTIRIIYRHGNEPNHIHQFSLSTIVESEYVVRLTR